MKKILFSIVLGMFLSFSAIPTFAQVLDEQNVSEVIMAMQPVLQLQMPTSPKIEFVFDDIQSYYGGITKYAATILRVSASVTWDLYAVGTSQNGVTWDQLLQYGGGGGANATSDIPLSILELRQYDENRYAVGASTGSWPDYSEPFNPPGSLIHGQNSIFYSETPYTPPTSDEKYIQGHSGTDAAQGAPGGSWLVAEPDVGGFTDYYFTIDYRILPGLPATFPAAGLNTGESEELIDYHTNPNIFAQPGVYGMNVKFVLLEDQ